MMWRARWMGIILAMCVAWGACAGQSSATRRSSSVRHGTATAANEFSARVTQYLELRKQKAGSSPHPTESARKLVETRDQLRERIQSARPNAKPGDIFTPRVAAFLRKQIAEAFRGPAGARVLTSLRRAEPVKTTVRVNEPYPDGIPLQSMPPSLLMKLPKLPKELEYRIVNRDLVLLDSAPNLVVDILSNAIPAS